MILTCKECNTYFSVADSLIGANGTKVRCSICKFVWTAKLHQEEKPKRSTTNLIKPAIEHKQIKFIWFSKTSSILTLLLLISNFLIFFVFSSQIIPHKFPKLTSIYEKMGLIINPNLILDEISIEKVGKINDYDLILKGVVFNNSPNLVKLPKIKLSLLDKDKNFLIAHIDDIAIGKSLLAGEKYKITNKITNLSNKIHFLIIEIGTKTELRLRKDFM